MFNSFYYIFSLFFVIKSFSYRDIRDIDLYSGAMTELPVPGGIVGPTFGCLIARQFSMYKKGDRFWYENNHMHGFTEGW